MFGDSGQRGSERGGGLFGSVRRVADTCLSSVHNRVELFALELQEEKLRLMRLLLWTGAALFATFLAMTVATIGCVFIFAPDDRPLVVIVFAILYAVVALVTWTKLRHQIKNAPPPLTDTMAELKKDLDALRSKE
jgi:uncharacterized membrane protein YqjE